MPCTTCRGNGFVPASKTHRWFVTDCPACGGPEESIEEQAERLRERVRDLESQLRREREQAGAAADLAASQAGAS